MANAKIEELGNQFIAYVMNVEDLGQIPTSPTANWPLGSIQSAALVLACYLAFVILGVPLVKSLGIKRHFYGLRFAYNLAQVVLCSYMCVESVLLAYRNGYSIIPCNPFDNVNPPLGNLLWLFYVSKVLDFMVRERIYSFKISFPLHFEIGISNFEVSTANLGGEEDFFLCKFF
jgi:hypothetical protein